MGWCTAPCKNNVVSCKNPHETFRQRNNELAHLKKEEGRFGRFVTFWFGTFTMGFAGNEDER